MAAQRRLRRFGWLGLAVCTCLGGVGIPVAAQAVSAQAGAPARGKPQWARSNTGATHSPKVLHQLASAAAQNAASNISNAPALLPGAAKGIDVASFQHPSGAPIDWSQVAAAGVKFAAVKVTEGAYYTNPYAAADLQDAKAAGLSTVAYAFAIPNGGSNGKTQYSSDPVVQADDLINALTSNGVTVPALMLDIEYDPYAGSDGTPAGSWCYGLSQSAMVSWISSFSTEIQARTGWPPIIYTVPQWWSTCTGDSTTSGQAAVWVPDYSASGGPASLPAGWSSWNFWQYSSTGTVAGIPSTGATDLDQLNPAMITMLDSGLRQSAPGQTTVAGSPVQRQFVASDSAPGAAPTFTASGLPPGLAVSSAGQITGWPDKPGTYQPAVSAADTAGGSGSAQFTWTVSAAPDSGPAGPLRLDLAGKCLNDVGNRSSNNTALDIWACNGSTSQQWTVVKDDTLRIHGKCLDVYHSHTTNGTSVQLYTCNGSAAQQWQLRTGGQLVNPNSGKCLTDPGGSTTNGTRIKIWSCSAKSYQKWRLPAGPVVSLIPGKCLDDSAGRTTNGNKIDSWACNGQASQRWVVYPDNTVRIKGKCLDVYHGGTADNTPVDLYTCNGSAAQKWTISASGSGTKLVNPLAGSCLTVPGDSTTNGTALVIQSCPAPATGQTWRVQ